MIDDNAFFPVLNDAIDEINMACPFCGWGYVRPTSIRCNPGGNVDGLIEIESNGVSLDNSVKPEGRGVKIELFFRCEDGHAFCYSFHFHKGYTYVEKKYDERSPEDVIWRD